jgi:hypothetical protein
MVCAFSGLSLEDNMTIAHEDKSVEERKGL